MSVYSIPPMTVSATSTNLPTAPVPFPGPQPKNLPATIEAENFDRGGEGTGYHEIAGDLDSGIYRGKPVEGVDIQAFAGASAGFVVTEAAAGEWLSYTVLAPFTGSYELGMRYTSMLRNGSVHLEIDGQDVTGAITVTVTGANFRNVFKRVDMTAGKHDLRLVIDSNSVDPETGKAAASVCDLDSFSFRVLKAKVEESAKQNATAINFTITDFADSGINADPDALFTSAISTALNTPRS
jgi:Carbohydrate binding module (family 6)